VKKILEKVDKEKKSYYLVRLKYPGFYLGWRDIIAKQLVV